MHSVGDPTERAPMTLTGVRLRETEQAGQGRTLTPNTGRDRGRAMPLTRREMLGTTALVTAIAVTDMLGPNGSWGPLVWPSDAPPPVRLSVDFDFAAGGNANVIVFRGHSRAEAKAESHGTLTVLRTASNRQPPEIAA